MIYEYIMHAPRISIDWSFKPIAFGHKSSQNQNYFDDCVCIYKLWIPMVEYNKRLHKISEKNTTQKMCVNSHMAYLASLVKDRYSAYIKFFHQSTKRLPVHGCTNSHE